MKLKGINISQIAKKLFTSKAIIGSVLLAIALWSYTSLSGTYISIVKLPLIIDLPSNRAIEINPPEKISIEVRGSGWEIFNLIFFNSAAKVEIDLKKRNIHDSIYRINRNDIIKNVLHLTNLQAIDVAPQSIILHTGTRVQKEIEIESLLKIIPKDGFVIIGNQKIIPENIIISGNQKVMGNINKWQTQRTEISNVYNNFTTSLSLHDTLRNIVELSTSIVKISANVQQAAVMTFYDIPIKINGGSLPSNHRIEPPIISVRVRSGIKEIESLLPEQIEVSIDFSDIINDKTGFIKLDVKAPKYIEVIGISPEYIQHKKIIKSLKQIKDKNKYL